MFIEELELQNYCQHQQRRWQFKPGLVGILGPNGSGKTNILNAALLALTGVNRNAGPSLLNRNRLAAEDAACSVRLTFQHAGQRAQVTRTIGRRNTATLVLDGATFQGDGAVNQQITQLLGVSADILQNTVMVSQADIFGFLDESPVRRVALLQRLFRIDCEAAAKVFNEHRKSLTEIPPMQSIDGLQRQAAVLRGQVQELEQTFRAFPDVNEVAEEQRAADTILRVARDRVSVLERLQRLTQDVDGARTAVQNSRQVVNTAIETRMKIREVWSPAQHEELQRLSYAWAAYDQACSVVATISNGILVGIDAELAALVEPLPASDYLVAEVRQQRMDSAAYKLNQSRQLLNALPDGSRMCPVCQTPADTLAPRVAEVQRLLPQLENDYVDLARRDRRDREYERTLADVRARRAALEQSRQQNMLKLQEAQQAVGTPPVMPREEVAVAWQQACLNASNLTMTEQFLASLQPQLHGQEGRLVALEGELQQTRKQLAELADYTAEEVAAAKQRSAGAAHMAITIAACSAARSVATSSLKNIEAEIAQAIEASQRAAGMLAWQRVVQTGCDLLHPMAAPRAVVQRRLTEQLVDVNGYLDSFGADFRVRIDAEANIHAIMHRGYEQPAARLSHGQLSRLAFAFRLAINLSQAAGINALYLDEPTAFLDYQSLDHFEAVFRRLRTMAAERSFQCWIITHAQRLTSLFDQVVEV